MEMGEVRKRHHKCGDNWVYILDYDGDQVYALVGAGAGREAEYDESMWDELYKRAGIDAQG
jgi:hypothetical protein